ncbi:MAG: M1 family metallopeptidase [marine benthic group bacterium]|nr:M1 family metallopeptidase [Gemmatimonadota bacterium]
MRPLDGDGLVATAPVFPPVVPPSRYDDALTAGTRSLVGRPGAGYWQQAADYRIAVEIDPKTARLTGSETITYHNNSPDQLNSIVVRFYQNVFSEGVTRNRSVTLTGGIDLNRIAVNGLDLGELEAPRFENGRVVRPEGPGYRLDGTVAVVQLEEPLPTGGSVELEVDWGFTVSGGGGFRNGHLDNSVFNVAQWYPQVSVYDDVFGWDRSQYLGNGEFYVGYGRFEVDVTVPEGWVVVGTGMLQNPDEVLRPEQVRALRSAPALDTVIAVVSEGDLEAGNATRPSETGKLTWRFAADSVRDFAFAASDRYLWHVTGADTGNPGHRALIQNVYTPDNAHWSEATLYAKHAIEFFSDYILPYPYPQATAAMGPPQVNGMEYPMVTFITHRASGRGLNGVVTHELSHFWMPMIVGTKEMAYAWMDEGFTVFNTALAMDDWYETSDSRKGSMNGYLQAARFEAEVPIMRHTDYADNPFGRSVAAYSKPGTLLHSLRHMLGAERFDEFYRDYARTWAFKHPMPWDFFNMAEEAAGTDLDWFWQAWFYDTAVLDQAISEVRTTGEGVDVTVENLEWGVMPVEIRVGSGDGSTETVVLPASVWAGTRSVTTSVPFEGEVDQVVIDPDEWYPDIDRSNNSWKRPTS